MRSREFTWAALLGTPLGSVDILPNMEGRTAGWQWGRHSAVTAIGTQNTDGASTAVILRCNNVKVQLF